MTLYQAATRVVQMLDTRALIVALVMASCAAPDSAAPTDPCRGDQYYRQTVDGGWICVPTFHET
jgi:hypothetical protein